MITRVRIECVMVLVTGRHDRDITLTAVDQHVTIQHRYVSVHKGCNFSRKGAKLAKKNLCGLGVLARDNDFFHASLV